MTALRGTAFDTGLFLWNVVTVSAAPQSFEATPQRTAGMALAAGVFTQIAGAALKRRPLQARLREQQLRSPSPGLGGFMKALLLLHFILFWVAGLMSLELLGIAQLDREQGWSDDLWIVVAMVAAGAATGMVAAAGRVPKSGKVEGPAQASAEAVGLREAVGDLCLWISVIIMTRAFWGLIYLETTNIHGIGLSRRGIVFLVASSLLFVAFYLPQRFLLLVEDRRSFWTWVRVWAAMLPLAAVVLIG